MSDQISLDPKKLSAAIMENLNRHFFAGERDAAKQLYRLLGNGQQAPFMRIDGGAAGEVFCELSLDHSEYVGKLNFGRFRKQLAMMLLAIKHRVEGEQAITHLSSDQGEMLFNIPGIVQDDSGVSNVLVFSLRQAGPGLLYIRLLFLNPDNYYDALHSS